MTRKAKSLKRNDEACEGILIAPSKLPQNHLVFSLALRFQRSGIFTHCPERQVGFGFNFAAWMASRPPILMSYRPVERAWTIMIAIHDKHFLTNWYYCQ
jgi:hypothetical protein